MKRSVGTGSGVMTYIPTFMKTGRGVERILRFCLRNLKGCNVGITDGRDISIGPLKLDKWHDIRTTFHDDRFRSLSNITVITATI
jgi:hypothetical protein